MNVYSRFVFILASCVCAACTHESGSSEQPMEPKPMLQPQLASESPATSPTVSPATEAVAEQPKVEKLASANANAVVAEPNPATMQHATPSAKLNAPIDVLYQLRDEVAPNQPLRIDFAVVPRIAGTDLRFELVESESAIVETAGKLSVQKADASGIYRKSVALTPRVGSFKLQVIVYMNAGSDTYSGVYSIPVGLEAMERKDGKQSVRREPQ